MKNYHQMTWQTFFRRVNLGSAHLPEDLKRVLQTVKAGRIRKNLADLNSLSGGSRQVPNVSIVSAESPTSPNFSTFKEYYNSLTRHRLESSKGVKRSVTHPKELKKMGETKNQEDYEMVGSFHQTKAAKALRREYKRDKTNKKIKSMSQGEGVTEGEIPRKKVSESLSSVQAEETGKLDPRASLATSNSRTFPADGMFNPEAAFFPCGVPSYWHFRSSPHPSFVRSRRSGSLRKDENA